jgi:hypothetical protein
VTVSTNNRQATALLSRVTANFTLLDWGIDSVISVSLMLRAY